MAMFVTDGVMRTPKFKEQRSALGALLNSNEFN